VRGRGLRPHLAGVVVEDLLQLLMAGCGPSATSRADPLTAAPEGKAVALFFDEQGRF
jgi:hypothetical protein